MPPRNPELPEGTDHIVNGAMETSDGASSGAAPMTGSYAASNADAGSGGGTPAGGASSGFVGSNSSDDTGGTSTGGGSGVGIKQQLRDGASGIQQQAGERVRAFADTGKDRATTALDDFSRMVSDAASSIDDRLGAEYGEYARRAADTVSGLADNLRNKQVDELFEDGKELVRKSPGVALGVAAVVGFTLVRLVKAGLEAPQGGSDRDVTFQPTASLADDGGTAGSPTSTTGV